MRPFLYGFLLFTVVVPAVCAEPGDIARLFPEETILYAEVVQPGEVAKELSALFKGSTLENPAPFFAQSGQTWKENQLVDRSDAGILAALLGPAMLKEAGKFTGLALAVTRLDIAGNADFVMVLKPGESRLPQALLHSYLKNHRALKKVSAVENVDIFQDNGLTGIPMGLPPFEESTPLPRFALAQAPDLIVLGSNQEQVATVIRRWKDKEKSVNFTSSAGFPEVVEGRKRPGLFIYGKAQGLAYSFTPLQRSSLATNPTLRAAVKELLPAAGLKHFTAHLALTAQGVDGSAAVDFVPGKTIPLFDFLNGQAIRIEQIQALPSTGSIAVTLAFPKGGQRLNKVLALLDILVKASGTLGPTAGELLEELIEKKQQPDPRQILGKITGLTLVLPITADSKSKIPLPIMIFETEDDVTAQALDTFVPAILGIIRGETKEPIAETIEGQKIRSIAQLGTTLHYGKKDNRFGLGPDRRAVARTLLADKKVKPGLDEKNLSRAVLATAVRWDELLKSPAEVMSEARPGRKDEKVGPWTLYTPRSTGPMKKGSALEEQLSLLPPLWVTLRRQDDRLCINWQQSAPKTGFAQLITQGFAWYAHPSETMEPYRLIEP